MCQVNMSNFLDGTNYIEKKCIFSTAVQYGHTLTKSVESTTQNTEQYFIQIIVGLSQKRPL